MKKVILAGIIGLASIFGTGNIYAEAKNGKNFKNEAKAGKHQHKGKKQRGGDIDAKLDKWKTELGLTDKQTVEIRAIMQEYKQKKDQLKASGKEVNKEDYKAMRKEMSGKIKAVLTPAQQAKLDEMRKDSKKHGHKGHKGHKNKEDKK